jgi:hypothetical protein
MFRHGDFSTGMDHPDPRVPGRNGEIFQMRTPIGSRFEHREISPYKKKSPRRDSRQGLYMSCAPDRGARYLYSTFAAIGVRTPL